MDLKDAVRREDVRAIKQHMTEHGLCVKDGRIIPKDAEAANRLRAQAIFWNQRQQARKILLG